MISTRPIDCPPSSIQPNVRYLPKNRTLYFVEESNIVVELYIGVELCSVEESYIVLELYIVIELYYIVVHRLHNCSFVVCTVDPEDSEQPPALHNEGVGRSLECLKPLLDRCNTTTGPM